MNHSLKKTFFKVIIGVMILAISAFIYIGIKEPKPRKKPSQKKVIKTAFVQKVQNSQVPINIKTTGVSIAKDRIELYSEVEGVLRKSNKAFKAGQHYRKGEVLVRMTNISQQAKVQTAKTQLYNLIVASLPDLKADYPQAFNKWEQYINQFKFDKPLRDIPKPSSDKEKYFINSRKIISTYYDLKTQQTLLDKYTLIAPFDGVLIESNVSKGTLVRPNQKLGVFINPLIYEIEIAVNQSLARHLQIGSLVNLQTIEGMTINKGKVVRINGSVNRDSQTISLFVQTTDKSLREGMYLEVSLYAKEISDAYTLPRELLQQGNQIFGVKDDRLIYLNVQPMFFDKQTVVVKGIPDGSEIISKMIPSAYEGMLIKRHH